MPPSGQVHAATIGRARCPERRVEQAASVTFEAFSRDVAGTVSGRVMFSAKDLPSRSLAGPLHGSEPCKRVQRAFDLADHVMRTSVLVPR